MEPKKEPEHLERCEVVVDSISVAAYSQKGYRTIEIREEDISTIQHVNVQEVLPGTSYPTQVMKQVPQVLRVLKFHMVRSGESRIGELSVQLDAANSERDVLRAIAAECEKTITSLKSNSDSLTRDIERRRVELEKELKLTSELRERLRKMEGDIAKFRKEIGEQRWREITTGA